MQEQGTLSVNTENIFPIIKKFLYSDNEIFLRELVSNAVDATQKIKRLSSLGEFTGEIGDTTIEVSFDAEAKTITVSDKGIGMTADEIKKYINQIAFSGATEFVEKYKNAEDAKQIIGHFGLGFYSAFMVAKRVEIISRSYKPEAMSAAHWTCEGSTSFELTESEAKEERGTDIILHIADDATEFLDENRLRGILEKYCRFLPVSIKFGEKIINEVAPIWTKSPSDLEEKDYKEFYKSLYPYSDEPLFWIHLNVDYPFELTGVLYFPKIKQDLSMSKDKIQLYSRQVFITDEVKDIVPEFLTLLHGVIDSPDIPLNVSRSYLQADGNVRRISNYIMKKVAEKLQELFKNERESFETKWKDIGVFVKFGMITEEKFYEKANKFALLTNIEGKNFTTEEYIAHIEAEQTDKNEQKIILYTIDPENQHTFIQSAKKRGYDVLLLDGPLDNHFINNLESKLEKVQFKRIDSDSIDKIIEKEHKIESLLSEEKTKKVKEVFEKTIQDPSKTVQVEALPPDEMPVTVVLPEFMRRMKEMSQMSSFGVGAQMPDMSQVVVNANHALITQIAENEEEEHAQKAARQLYDLALLSQNMLKGEALSKFIDRSLEMVK
ncbi:MAG: molecular chaperone HtpG [Bernardetiaceae bacterium]|nr:molecular chaperone HtpG [Bernardetiaceae bacterium]